MNVLCVYYTLFGYFAKSFVEEVNQTELREHFCLKTEKVQCYNVTSIKFLTPFEVPIHPTEFSKC